MTDFFRRTLTYDEAPKGTKNEDWVPGETEEAIRAAIARVNGETTMDDNDGTYARILAERLAKQDGHTLGIVTVSGEALQVIWNIAALRDEPPLEDVLLTSLVDDGLPGRDVSIAYNDGEWHIAQWEYGLNDREFTGVHGHGPTIRAAVASAKGQGE